jgi:hypothetical protein
LRRRILRRRRLLKGVIERRNGTWGGGILDEERTA